MLSALRMRLRRLYRECALTRPKGAPESRKVIVAIIGLDYPTDFPTPGAVAQPVRAGDS